MHHPRPHNNLQVRMLEISLFTAGLMASVLLFGCTPESSGPDNAAGPGLNATPDSAKMGLKTGPNAGKTDKAASAAIPLPGESFKISGYSVAKADDLLNADTNPFLNKSPIPEVVMAPEGGTEGQSTEPVAPPADPYQGITLTGILYNPNNPVALLSVGDDVDSSRQLIKKGETFYNNGQGFKVVNMTKSRVDIKLNNGSGIRTLYLPEIIGYGKGGTTDNSSVSDIANKMSKESDDDLTTSLKKKLESVTESEKLKPGESNKSILKLDEP